MSYVTWVFETYFGYSRAKAERLMLDVHQLGKAVVSNGTREKMERDTEALQGYGLWATFSKDE
jgi:ATP-dependent Clp protease adaptor protein ClpS